MRRSSKPTGASLRTLLALASAVLGSWFLLAASAQALPRDFWGIVPQGAVNDAKLSRIHRGGVEAIRLGIAWPEVQPTEDGALNWSNIDAAVGASAKAHIDVLPFVYGAPGWAVPDAIVPGSEGSLRAPLHLPASGAARAAWVAFVRAAVQRYGPRGSFWAENPTIPKRPVRIWQIWNEPNFKYFVVRPNPAEYGALVKASAAAIRGADAGARIILAGLFARPIEARSKARPRVAYFATEFLTQMYRRSRGVRASFDGIALHPYTREFRYLKPEIEEVRAVLKRQHDARTGVWITELGWSSGHRDPGNVFAKGPAGQVQQLKGAFKVLVGEHAKWNVKAVYWFSLEDAPGACNFCDGSGLFTQAFAPKRSWAAYVRFAGGRP